MENQEQEVQELTFGQKAVGFKFNPSKLNSVDEAKLMLANAIDQMNDFRNDEKTCSGAKRHASTAITMLEDAQMRMVKALTWQD